MIIKGVDNPIVNWEYLGALLARGCGEDQALFLKAFVKECLSWGTHFQVEQQLAFVNLLLSKDEREVLSMISYEEVK